MALNKGPLGGKRKLAIHLTETWAKLQSWMGLKNLVTKKGISS